VWEARAGQVRLGRASSGGGAGCDGRVNHNAVVGVRRAFDFVDGFAILGFEAYLAAKGPDTAHARVISQGAEDGMVLGRQVFEDRIFVSDTVGGGVRNSGERFFLVFED